MPDKKISQLDSTTSVNTGAMFPLSQTESGNLKTVKGTVDQIGDYIAKTQDHSTLNTVSKKIIGAINEILASGDIEGTASGSVASFNDGGDNIPVKSLVVNITAQQVGSGTPSPSNVRAISGFDSVVISRSGKNLFNPNLIQFGTYSNGVWNLTTASGDSGKVAYKDFFKENTQYTFSGHEVQSDTDRNVRLRIYYTDGTTQNLFTDITTSGKNFSVTSLADKTIETVNIIYSGQGTVEITNFQIELGTTATTYDSYKGTTHTIALGSTVYVGTLDVTTGILKVTHAYQLFDGSESWNYSSSDTRQCVFIPISGAKGGSINLVGNIIEANPTPTNNYPDEWKGAFNSNATPSLLIGVSSNITSAQDFKDLIANTNLQVVYELSTPVVIQLTPTEVVTLLGENNIYANSGDVEVEYFTNKANEIAELIEAEIASLSTDFHVYSTNEKVVGRWIDGKPIYEKTFSATFANIASGTPTNMADISGIGINEVVNVDGACKYEFTGQPTLYEALGSHFFCYAYPTSKLQFAQTITQQTTNRNYTVKAVMRYTKTTD